MPSIRLLVASVCFLWSFTFKALASPVNDRSISERAQGSKSPVHFEINLTWGDVAPDGFMRKAILMNGQFPGPTLHLNQGDDVEFWVTNNLPFPTTVHFHGMASFRPQKISTTRR
jgi:FtsP/CotA-like multicopper oxidase with cupredoxin domain